MILAQVKCFLYGEKLGCDPGAQIRRKGFLRAVLALALGVSAGQEGVAQQVDDADYLKRRYDFGAPAPSAAASARLPAWIQVPRADGRITHKELGLVINTTDRYSVEVGEFYIKARGLNSAQVLRLQLPVRPVLTPEEFKAFALQVDAFFGARVQALALAWTYPYAVGCNSITGALALGFDPALCSNSCAPSARSPYFNNASTQPHAQLKMRPSMLLAARDVAMAMAMIERGVASDGSLGLRGGLPAHAYFVATGDRARDARQPLFPPAGPLQRVGIEVHVETAPAIENASRVLIYETGAVSVPKLDTIRWVPGALADHLTS